MKKLLIKVYMLFNIVTVFNLSNSNAQCTGSISINTSGSWVLASISPAGAMPPLSSLHPGPDYVSAPPAQWLGVSAGSSPSSVHLIFRRTFYVGKAGNYQINFQAAADNILNVYIDNQVVSDLLLTDNSPGTGAFNKLYPAAATKYLACGEHVIIADVYNYLMYSGFILNGSISGECLSESPIACIIPQPCCNNKFPFWTNIPYPESYSFDGGTYSVEDFNVQGPNTVPITEIRATVESFQLLSKYDDCIPCKMTPVLLGSIASLWNIGTGANTLSVQAQPYGSMTSETNFNEVIWKNPGGVSLNSGDIIKLMYILPPESEIPCCVDSAKICIRISYKDVNCGYCEVYNCTTIALRQPVKPGDGKGKMRQGGKKSLREIIDSLGLKGIGQEQARPQLDNAANNQQTTNPNKLIQCTPWRNVIGIFNLCKELNSLSICDISTCTGSYVSTSGTNDHLSNNGNVFWVTSTQNVSKVEQADMIAAAKSWAIANSPFGYTISSYKFNYNLIVGSGPSTGNIGLVVTYKKCTGVKLAAT